MRPLDLLLRPRGFVVAVALMCLLSLAHAQEVCYAYRAENFVDGSFPTPTAACEAMMAAYSASSGNTATVTSTSGNNCRVTLVYSNGNPTEYDKSFGTFTQVTADCPDPTACSPSVGQDKTVNLTVGWSRQSAREAAVDQSLDAYKASIVSPVTRPSTACAAGCSYNVPSSGADGCWHATTPSSSGLFRLSCDFVVVGNGEECTADDDEPTSPTAPPPDCDGFKGEIGGVTRCVAPSGSGGDAAEVAPVPYKQGNPTAGSDAGAGLPGRNPASGPGGNAGGIAAGGDGGIRGGGAGGPGPGSGTGSGGTGESPKPKDPCGIPGSPPCKIDETGTPNGEGAFGAAGDGLNDARDELLGLIEGIKADEGPPAWTWTFALPTGCSPIPVGGFAPFLDPIDICEFQPLFHDLMSVAWLLGTVGGCVTLLYRTLVGGD